MYHFNYLIYLSLQLLSYILHVVPENLYEVTETKFKLPHAEHKLKFVQTKVRKVLIIKAMYKNL